MGKLDIFEIRLDNPSAVYFAGQTLSGNVHAIVNESMETRGIHLKLGGHGQVRWSERHRRNNETITRHYSASENYFEVNLNLMGNISGSDRQTLHPGEYTLPFSFVLPLQLPSSFEGRYGHVRYYCHAKIDLPWKFDPKCKVPVTVNALYDLNYDPAATVSYELITGKVHNPNHPYNKSTDRAESLGLHQCLENHASHIVQHRCFPSLAHGINQTALALSSFSQTVLEDRHKTLCCWCCKSGPISAVVRIDRRGHVPGEAILINAEITNQSTTEITRTRAVLRARTIYHATSKSRTETNKLAEEQRGAISPGESDVWSGVAITIPPVPPTHLGACKIIDMEYLVEFEVVLAGAHTNLSVELPITVGTIPLRTYFSNYAQQPPAYVPPPTYNEAVPMPIPSAPPLPEYPDLPPPSYMQTEFAEDNENEDDEHGQKLDQPYKPTYPCYPPKLVAAGMF